MENIGLSGFRTVKKVVTVLSFYYLSKVFEAGVHEDERGAVPYFAMELIPDAQPLIDYADAEDVTVRQRLELFARVCDAVHHGHQKGVIHRDLKPSNILVGRDGEPKVIDFGVARSTDADIMLTTQYTRTGDLVGTVHYMSPEQCDGDSSAIDTRTDIYSLGVVMYELLTGSAPYDTSGTTIYAAIRVIKDEQPRRPSEFKRRLRGDVEAILLKALEKDPARRYESAAGLAQDIRRHLAGETIEARSPTFATRVLQWAVRHPVFVTSAACILMNVIATIASAITVWYTSMRPDRIVVVEDGDIVQLQTATGTVLKSWEGGGRNSIRYAELIPAPAAPSGGPLVIIGYGEYNLRGPRGCFAFYDLDRERDASYMELRLDDADIPVNEIKPRRREDGRIFLAQDFGAWWAVLADVFPDPGGAAVDELIAVFKHGAVTHSGISGT
ncbi:MAG: serine/threonine-protein kinase [Planctomycetota bacterium]